MAKLYCEDCDQVFETSRTPFSHYPLAGAGGYCTDCGERLAAFFRFERPGVSYPQDEEE